MIIDGHIKSCSSIYLHLLFCSKPTKCIHAHTFTHTDQLWKKLGLGEHKGPHIVVNMLAKLVTHMAHSYVTCYMFDNGPGELTSN